METRQTITFFSDGGPIKRNVILKFYDNGALALPRTCWRPGELIIWCSPNCYFFYIFIQVRQ